MRSSSEGGASFGTAMPAFKTTLGESDRWEVLRYLRTLR
jgi:mono/diheme cytochrome c family protein